MAKKLWLAVITVLFCIVLAVPASADAPVYDDWYQDGNNWYYYDEAGNPVSGWLLVDSTWYYFDEDTNIMKDDTIFNVWNEATETVKNYIALPGGAVVLESNTWYEYNYDDYYLLADGSLATEWLKLGDNWYYFSYYGVEKGSFSVYDEASNTNKFYFANYDDGVVILSSGWYYDDHNYNWYYMNEDGTLVRDGFYKIGNQDYYFYYWGEMATGVFGYEDTYYFATNEGNIITTPGWLNYKNAWYYIKEDGSPAFDELLNIDGNNYCFTEYGNMVVGYCKISDVKYFCNDYGIVAEQTDAWHTASGLWVYIKADGTFASNEILEIGGVRYGFGPDYMYSNCVFQIDNTDYYAGESGAILNNGWIKDGFDYYYATSDGTLARGWEQIGNEWYYFTPKMFVGTRFDYDYNAWYNFEDSGRMVPVNTQATWSLVDGNWFYYPAPGEKFTGWVGNYYIEDNLMLTNQRVNVDGDYYFLDKNGNCVRGWATYRSSSSTRYYYADEYGRLQKGWKQIGGIWYYFSYNNRMNADDIYYIEEDGKNAEFSASGAFIGYVDYDKWYLTRNGEWFYVSYEYGTPEDFEEIGGIEYYFNDGYLVTNTSVFVDNQIWINAAGVRDYGSGWRQDNYGCWYYLENGVIPYEEYRTIGGKEYYFEWDQGMMVTGIYPAYNEVAGVYEYAIFDQYGVKQGIAQDGWYWAYSMYDEAFAWYYFVDGSPIDEGWHNLGGIDYCFFGDGQLANGVYYHTDDDISDINYLFNASGVLITNNWILIDGDWYYANAYGRALTGQHTIGGVTYYFDQYGRMI